MIHGRLLTMGLQVGRRAIQSLRRGGAVGAVATTAAVAGGASLFGGKKKRRRSGRGFSNREIGQLLLMKSILGVRHPAVVMYSIRAVGGRM